MGITVLWLASAKKMDKLTKITSLVIPGLTDEGSIQSEMISKILKPLRACHQTDGIFLPVRALNSPRSVNTMPQGKHVRKIKVWESTG